jgi:hypothetical protein
MNLLKKKASLLSPQAAKIVAVSVVTLAAVGAIVIIAHQAEPKASAAPSVKPAVTSQPAPVASTAKSATSVKGKTSKGGTTANGKGVVQTPEIVTITGCLEEKNDGFRLKDTSGTDAPKSRSWKTLGITKHASTVSVVDTTKKLKLASHVGERVSVTGAMLDKEIQLKSMKAVAPSCD